MKWNAALYDEKHSFVTKYGEELIDLLDPCQNEVILDIGCGTGHLSALIANRGARVVGLDISPEMLEKAKTLYPILEFVQADIREYAAPGSFDAAFSNATIHWIPEPQCVTDAIFALLKPRGRFVAEFGGKGNVHDLFEALRITLDEFGYGRHVDLDRWFYPSIGEYAAILEKSGFVVRYASHFDRPTPLDGTDGLKNWYLMFANIFFNNIPNDIVNRMLIRLEEILRKDHYKNSVWYADYRRLRLVAVKLP